MNATKTTTHTIGPWGVRGEYIVRADKEAEDAKNEYGYQSGHYIAKAISPIGGAPTMKANARLIAAAPDLLEACEALRAAAELSTIARPDVEEAARLACNAIAKTESKP